MSHTSDSVTVITSVTVLFHLPGVGLLYTHPCPMKITFTYNSVLTVIPVSFCTAYISVTFRVKVRVSFRVRVPVRDR